LKRKAIVSDNITEAIEFTRCHSKRLAIRCRRYSDYAQSLWGKLVGRRRANRRNSCSADSRGRVLPCRPNRRQRDVVWWAPSK